MNTVKAKVGDEVYYVVLERAEIMAVDNSETHAMIKVLTGLQKGQVFEAPWGKLLTADK